MTKEIKGICPECGEKVYDAPYEGYDIPMFFKCEECETVFYREDEGRGELSAISKEDEEFYEFALADWDDEEYEGYYDRLPSYKLREIIPVEKCARCGEDETLDLDVHHKNGVRWDNRPENLIALCSKCHRTVGKRWFLNEIGETIPTYEGEIPKRLKPRKLAEFIAENKRLNRMLEESVHVSIYLMSNYVELRKRSDKKYREMDFKGI